VRTSPHAAIACEPLWHVLYRYWFWGWLFLDVNTGDLLRRAAAWRHNVRQRVHLPVYMRRWLVALVMTAAAGCASRSGMAMWRRRSPSVMMPARRPFGPGCRVRPCAAAGRRR
jgi:hypothetical protein